jgi:hypothetical protein
MGVIPQHESRREMVMKKLFVFMLLLIPLAGISQNTVSLSLMPSDRGIGARFDHQFNDAGVYISTTQGRYKLGDDFYIKNHLKLSTGIIHYTKTNDGFLSIGVCLHKYGEKQLPIGINNDVFNPLSFEVGGGIRINHFSPSLTVDIFKWDVAVNFGFVF